MKAKECSLIESLQGPKQFIIPIYQRTYSWTEKQCAQLWDDVVKTAKKQDIPSHFIGSIVHIESGLYQTSEVPQLLVIDGQQRLVTITLLFTALAKKIDEHDANCKITAKKIQNYYLINPDEGETEKKYKLILTQSDTATLHALIEGKQIPEKNSKNIVNNFEYFVDKIKKTEINLDVLYSGIRKLIMVEIALDATRDKPQLIFESLNSTGLDLSQADLIRNYVLMGLEKEMQDGIYQEFWHPIEESFGHSEGSDHFDRFMRDYLTLKTGEIPNIKNVYAKFKEYYLRNVSSVEPLVKDIRYYAGLFTRLAFEKEPDPQINQIIHDINVLKVDVAYPFLLEVYADYDRGLISRDDVLEIFMIVESYVFRRAICDIPTNSLNKTFRDLAGKIDKSQYLQSLKAELCLKRSYTRFPTNKEFEDRFIRKDVYNTNRIRRYLLDKLENYGRKERVSLNEYTLEHIMPQNLSQEWKNDLGPDWEDVYEKYLHTIGNLTLTGYNPELSNESFLQKRDMGGGFANSPIRLNHDLVTLTHWNELTILNRSKSLAQRSVEIWKYPDIPQEILAKYQKTKEDDEEYDDEADGEWESRLEYASTQTRHVINTLISKIHEKFDCVDKPYSQWLRFCVDKPVERASCFVMLQCGKNTAQVAFRVDPSTFKDDDSIRKVKGFFFPEGTERRISLTEAAIPRILASLEHSYSVTQSLNKI